MTEKGCEYCTPDEYGEYKPIRDDMGAVAAIEEYGEGFELAVTTLDVWSDRGASFDAEVSVPIKACPMCGRSLR